jgi:hypothetical protein
MLTIQPPMILKYFAGRNTGSNQLFRSFFLSWEDTLWHLLSVYRVKQGTTILVPEFYCGDVVEHMQEHGLKVAYYPVNPRLVTPLSDLVQVIKESRPDIIVVFHPVGITNDLMREVKTWQKYLLPTTIIIEDCVHKIIEEKKITFVSERHFLIDSLRKVVPIQGSNLYSSIPVPAIGRWQSWQTLPYRLSVLYYWLVMQFWLLRTYYASVEHIYLKASRRADLAMVQGYDLIGSSLLASPGIKVMDYLSRRIPLGVIEKCKETQAKMYLQALLPLVKTANFWLPTMGRSDYKYLRGFPLIMSLTVADEFLFHLHANGINIRFELNDGPWSKKQKIIYLPMGLHVRNTDILSIAHLGM